MSIAVGQLFRLGRPIFALAIFAVGVETIVSAGSATHALGPRHAVIPVIPWLPAIPWLGYAFGAVLVACGAGLLANRTMPACAAAVGSIFIFCALVLVVPKYVPHPGSIALRTVVFEPLAIGALAWLLPGGSIVPASLLTAARYVLAVALIVFGVDHFLALAFIASLIPAWIPWHRFWAAFFGVAFVAAGLGIASNLLLRWAAAGIGTMFAIWVVTLHLPRVLGLYRIPGAPHDPNEWSSLLIAVALWGGSWALAATPQVLRVSFDYGASRLRSG